MATFEDFLNEKSITLKRRYTEAHPAKTVGNSARVRNAIIEALKDGKITVDEFNEIVSQHSSAPSKWTRGNKRFFKIEEDGVTLSKYGTKILNSLVTESSYSSWYMGRQVMGPNYSNSPLHDVAEKMFKKKFNKLNKKQQEEVLVTFPKIRESVDEAIGTKKPMGLTKDETLEVAKKIAEAISKVDKVKCTVNMKTLEEDSFDLDYDGDEFDGGTYMIIDDGSVINAAHNGLRVGHMKDSTKDFITFFKKHFGKLAKESLDEGLNKSDIAYQLAIDYTGNTKPKITKLNKKRIQIMYGYKINPQTVIDSIKKVEPDVELKHVKWSDKMTGGGFHIFDILESTVNEAKAPKSWDSQFTMKAIEAYKNGEFDLEDDKSIAEWDKEYNGGRAPKPAFNTKEVVSYAIKTGKKPNGDKMDENIKTNMKKENINEAKVNPAGYVKAGKLGYNDQFIGKRSLSYTLSVELGMNPDHEFSGGDWLGFDHVSMYVGGGKKEGTILSDALKGKYTYAELKSAAADFLGIKESVEINERAKATQMLKDVAKGFASEVEGIKLSKEMAQAYLDWLSQSAYGRKYNGLPFEHIFKASFNWGIDRYTKNLKGEYEELKQQSKAMKESTIYTDFDQFINESLNEKFNKVEHLSLLNKALKAIPGSQKQKEIIRQLNVVRKAGGMRPLKEAATDDFEQGGEDYLESYDTSSIDEAKPKINIGRYQREGKLGYNDQFHGRHSLSFTLGIDLGLNPDNEFGGGDWPGFDNKSLYVNGGKKEGTVLADALSGKHTYDDLKSALSKFLGIKESVDGFEQGGEDYLESFKLDESFTAKLTGIARTAKNVEDFIKKVFKHDKFKAFDTPKTQKDSYEKFLDFIKSHYSMVQQYESNKIEENTIYTSFQQFVNESLDINEALKSSKLRGLLSMKQGNAKILKAIYGFSKIRLDQIKDEQIIDIDPKQGKKAEGLVVYYTTQEKENPYAEKYDNRYIESNLKFKANTILGIGMGKEVAYMTHHYDRKSGKTGYSLTTNDKRSQSDIGINKKYKGYDSTGVYNVKRMIDLADAAFVINTAALPDSRDLQVKRREQKSGATALMDPKEFKNHNMEKYKAILQQRANSLPIDDLVVGAIEEVAKIMADGVKKREVNKYGEFIMGTGADGKAYRISDLNNFTNNLMQDYERWAKAADTVANAKEDKEDTWTVKYYSDEMKKYAKEIKDRLGKLKKRNLAW